MIVKSLTREQIAGLNENDVYGLARAISLRLNHAAGGRGKFKFLPDRIVIKLDGNMIIDEFKDIPKSGQPSMAVSEPVRSALADLCNGAPVAQESSADFICTGENMGNDISVKVYMDMSPSGGRVDVAVDAAECVGTVVKFADDSLTAKQKIGDCVANASRTLMPDAIMPSVMLGKVAAGNAGRLAESNARRVFKNSDMLRKPSREYLRIDADGKFAGASIYFKGMTLTTRDDGADGKIAYVLTSQIADYSSLVHEVGGMFANAADVPESALLEMSAYMVDAWCANEEEAGAIPWYLDQHESVREKDFVPITWRNLRMIEKI